MRRSTRICWWWGVTMFLITDVLPVSAAGLVSTPWQAASVRCRRRVHVCEASFVWMSRCSDAKVCCGASVRMKGAWTACCTWPSHLTLSEISLLRAEKVKAGLWKSVSESLEDFLNYSTGSQSENKCSDGEMKEGRFGFSSVKASLWTSVGKKMYGFISA